MSELHSVKAPDAPTEPDSQTRTFRVLERVLGGDQIWREIGTHSTIYAPAADEVGEQFGEGNYLLIELESDYSFKYVYPLHIVADRVYRLATDADEVQS